MAQQGSAATWRFLIVYDAENSASRVARRIRMAVDGALSLTCNAAEPVSPPVDRGLEVCAGATVNELFAATAEHVTAQHGTYTLHVTTASPTLGVPPSLLVLVRGEVADQDRVLCRVSSSCVTSTALRSIECECALQVDAALARIHSADRGILIYLTDQEGRGQGLTTKVRALANKNRGLDTFAAVEELGLDADVRTFDAVGPILEALDVRSIVLLTGNPDKRDALIDAGVKVEDTEPLEVAPYSWTRTSMRAKQARGHILAGRYTDDPLGAYP